MFGICPFYAVSVAAVFRLRATRAELPGRYRMWGYAVGALVFLAASVFLLVVFAGSQPLVFAIDGALVLSGIPVYWLWTRGRPSG